MGLLSMQHPSHNQQQGPSPSQHHPQLSRPSSVVHTQAQAHPSPQQRSRQASQQHPSQHQHHQAAPQQHPNAYPQAYPAASHHNANPQDSLNYYGQPSPYSTHSATSGYQSAEAPDMMAAAQIPRHHYPPMSYHTPQSNSPASVASPSQHDHHRGMYGQPPSQHMPPSMYYQPPPQYQPMAQPGASPYAQHAQHPSQAMTSQPNMMMSHPAPQNQMTSHPQHAPHHAQPGMTASPRPKMENQVPLQLQKQSSSSSLSQGHQQQQPNGNQMHSPGSSAASMNPNAAPGPIPATTPLVVRQDGNGVQWIAFEYSRDRVKSEYTIRCDVESVNIEELSPDFKQENCVYPRACCPKDQYRGNRLVYETECNRVGWALAQLNVDLRTKRGLIQRAVDSWRNSNQDPRLRSRRVRRMAKMTNRTKASMSPHPGANAHMPGPPPGVMAGGPGSMGHSTPSPAQMGKPTIGGIPQAPGMQHHPSAHHDGPHQNGDHVVNGASYDPHSHHQPATHGPNGDVRQSHVFTEYGTHGYPAPAPGPHMSHMAPHSGAIVTARHGTRSTVSVSGLLSGVSGTKKRKYALFEDEAGSRRSRVPRGQGDWPKSRGTEHPVLTPSDAPHGWLPSVIDDDRVQATEGRAISRRGSN